MKKLSGLLVSIAVTLVLLFAADRVLGLAGLPLEPPLSVAHAPSSDQTRQNLDFKFTIRTNSQGIRYPEIPLKKNSSGEFRVAVLGDSFDEGLGVEAEDTFPALLEKRFSGIRFINFGLIGAGPAEEARMLSFRALRYEPDLVLLVLYANDLTDTGIFSDEELRTGEGWLTTHKRVPTEGRGRMGVLVHRLFPRIHALVKSAQKKFEAGKPLDFLGGTIAEARRLGIPEERIEAWKKTVPPEIVDQANRLQFDGYLYSNGLLRQDFLLEGLDLKGGQAEKRWRSVQAMLSKIAEICRANKIPLALVYAPAPFQSDPSYVSPSKAAGVFFRDEWLTEESELQKRISGWARDNGLLFLDMTPAFREAAAQNPGKLHFRHDPHWTPEGQRAAASIIGDWLSRENLLGGR